MIKKFFIPLITILIPLIIFSACSKEKEIPVGVIGENSFISEEYDFKIVIPKTWELDTNDSEFFATIVNPRLKGVLSIIANKKPEGELDLNKVLENAKTRYITSEMKPSGVFEKEILGTKFLTESYSNSAADPTLNMAIYVGDNNGNVTIIVTIFPASTPELSDTMISFIEKAKK